MYVYGGSTFRKYYGNIKRLNLINYEWEDIIVLGDLPKSRMEHTCVLFTFFLFQFLLFQTLLLF